MEPPRPDLPPGAGLTLPVTTTIRLGAGAGTLVLAVLSRGDVLVLAALLALLAWRPPAVAALVPALVAGGWRWGSTSLEAISGAQAVLGPAGFVGSLADAASAWLAALAVVLVVPDLRSGREAGGWWRRSPAARQGWWAPSSSPAPPAAQFLVAVAAGSAAAAVVAGPAPGGAVWTRVVGAALATLGALLVASLRRRPSLVRGRPIATVLDTMAAVVGLLALLLAKSGAPPWSGTLDAGAVAAGAALAVATGALFAVLVAIVPALRDEPLRRRTQTAGAVPRLRDERAGGLGSRG